MNPPTVSVETGGERGEDRVAVAFRAAVDRIVEALDSVSPRDTTTILAALAVRLH